MKTVALVFGTRPEAIKLAPVERVLKVQSAITCIVCVTGQHREMLDQVLSVFDIPVHTDLDLMQRGQTPTDVLVRAVAGVDRFLQVTKPNLVLVQGDTTTALAAALAAFHLGIPVGHVEAGLRTFDVNAPWPEEANRQLIARLARLHFAPTASARTNLIAEGVPEAHIAVTGNTVVDALLLAYATVLRQRPAIPGVLDSLVESGRLVLITGHRRENFGGPLENVCSAVRFLAARFPEFMFVYPVHLNPRVRDVVEQGFGTGQLGNVRVIEPLAYLAFVRLLASSALVITDSGGIQEEAPTFGVPVLVTRGATERHEAVDAGVAEVVGTDETAIVKAASRILSLCSNESVRPVVPKPNPFGDGRAAGRIADGCIAFLDGGVASVRAMLP